MVPNHNTDVITSDHVVDEALVARPMYESYSL